MADTVTYYTITYDHVQDWCGGFFRQDQRAEAEAALRLMHREIRRERSVSWQALYLEEITIPLPINEAVLFELLNDGPLVVFGDRKIVNIYYVG
ncbi:hypothetical protein JAU75_01860 [Ochrobactrum sp. Q0168]|uniref:hypothetical protein n=1 Tax=Ochrobactrum sp. Q0168 TaxID=2793241 RepID=UPI0018EC3D78|nr:hypothetical protein [Ochrobactrum sp. Q0168]